MSVSLLSPGPRLRLHFNSFRLPCEYPRQSLLPLTFPTSPLPNSSLLPLHLRQPHEHLSQSLKTRRPQPGTRVPALTSRKPLRAAARIGAVDNIIHCPGMCVERGIDEADAAFAGEKAVAIDEGDDGSQDWGGEGCT